jgi:hypothetical protein
MRLMVSFSSLLFDRLLALVRSVIGTGSVDRKRGGSNTNLSAMASLPFSVDPKDGTSETQINAIAFHPTKRILITAHEDKLIRFVDVDSGSCLFFSFFLFFFLFLRSSSGFVDFLSPASCNVPHFSVGRRSPCR